MWKKHFAILLASLAVMSWSRAYAINVSEDLDKTIINQYKELQYNQESADDELSKMQTSRQQFWEYMAELQKELDKATLVLYAQDGGSLLGTAQASEMLNNICNSFHQESTTLENWLQTMTMASTRHANIREALQQMHTEHLQPQTKKYLAQSISICDTLDSKFASLRDSIALDQQRYNKFAAEVAQLENTNRKVVNQIRTKIFQEKDQDLLSLFSASSLDYSDFDFYYDKNFQHQANDPDEDSVKNKIDHWENISMLIALILAIITGLALRFLAPKGSQWRSKRWFYAFLVYLAVKIASTYLMPLAIGLNSSMSHLLFAYTDVYLFIFWMTLSAIIRLDRPGLGWSIAIYLPLSVTAFLLDSFASLMARDLIIKITMPIVLITVDTLTLVILAIGRKRILKADYAAIFSCVGVLLASTVLVFMGYHYPAYMLLLCCMSVMTYVAALVCFKRFFAKRISQAGPILHLSLTHLIYPYFYIYALLQSLQDVANVFNLKAWLADQFATPFVSLPQFGVISVSRIIFLIVVGIFVNYAIKLVKLLLLRTNKSKYETGSYAVAITLGTMITWFCYGLLALMVLQINHSGVIAAIGGASLGIGFAMKETFENLISGLQLMASRARPGDLVECANTRGVIKRIGILSTQIEMEDGPYVSIPNRQLLGSTFTNLTLNRRREIRHIIFDISADSDLQLAKKLMIEASHGIDGVVDHEKHYVVMRNTNSGIVRLDYKCWIDSAYYLRAEPAVREAIFRAFRANGIKIADLNNELGMLSNTVILR